MFTPQLLKYRDIYFYKRSSQLASCISYSDYLLPFLCISVVGEHWGPSHSALRAKAKHVSSFPRYILLYLLLHFANFCPPGIEISQFREPLLICTNFYFLHFFFSFPSYRSYHQLFWGYCKTGSELQRTTEVGGWLKEAIYMYDMQITSEATLITTGNGSDGFPISLDFRLGELKRYACYLQQSAERALMELLTHYTNAFPNVRIAQKSLELASDNSFSLVEGVDLKLQSQCPKVMSQ